LQFVHRVGRLDFAPSVASSFGSVVLAARNGYLGFDVVHTGKSPLCKILAWFSGTFQVPCVAFCHDWAFCDRDWHGVMLHPLNAFYMNFKHILLAALLFSASASPLSADSARSILAATESLSDATVQRVLALAAPLLGTSSANLNAGYQAGTVTITDLGPVRDGHRYGVTRGSDYVIIDDLVVM
jgi:hypothetical protein